MGLQLEDVIQEELAHDIIRCYPSTASLEESDFLTAEEALAQEQQLLGKRGVPHDFTCLVAHGITGAKCSCGQFDDDIPEFLQQAVKAGPVKKPPLDLLGRKRKDDTPAILMPPPSNDLVKKPQRIVTITKDHDLEYPDLYMAVHVLPDPDVRDDEARFAKMFARSGCYRAKSLEEADLVIFGGGTDVDPTLYHESRHPMTFFDSQRDTEDMDSYLKCRELGIPMLGVCRGAQFLHVMNGGKLYQDIDNHQGEHKGFAIKEKLLIERVSSVHHQAVRLNMPAMEVLMTTTKSSYRWKNADEKETGQKPDIEAFFYRDSGCFGVQGHPEYSGYNKFTVWVLEKIQDLFLTSPDFSWDGPRLRMTQSGRDAGKIAAQYIENAYSQSKEAN